MAGVRMVGGVHGRGCAWQGVCMAGGACVAGGMHGRGVCGRGGHVWRVGMCGVHAWQGGMCGRGACMTCMPPPPTDTTRYSKATIFIQEL